VLNLLVSRGLVVFCTFLDFSRDPPKLERVGGVGGGGFLRGGGTKFVLLQVENVQIVSLSAHTYPPKRVHPNLAPKPPRWGGTIRYTEPTFLVFFVVLHILLIFPISPDSQDLRGRGTVSILPHSFIILLLSW